MKPAAVRYFAGSVCTLVAVVFLGSCTGAPPEATHAEIVRAYVEDRELDEVYEQLTIRFHVQDPDGIDDVETLHVSHDGEGYVWSLEKGQWLRRQGGGAELFVVDGLATPNGSPLPRGQYRVIAVDSAGHKSEVSVSLRAKAPALDELSFPRLILEDDTISARGEFEEVRVIGYGDNNRRLGELELAGGESRSAREVGWIADGRREEIVLFAVAWDPAGEFYLESGPYRW